MSFYRGPIIVRDSSLQCCIDVLDRNSNKSDNSLADIVTPSRAIYLQSTTFGGGGAGKYIRCDGTGAGSNLVGSRINIGTTASQVDRFNINSNFSFVILAYPEGSGRIFSTGSAGSGTTDNCIWQMWLNQSQFYWWNSGGGGTDNINSLTGTFYATNTWNHIVITYSSSGPTARVYLNGVLAGTHIGATNLVDRTGQTDLQWTLGGGYNGSCFTENTASRFQQFLIYNKTLSATEVIQNFNAVRARVGI